jgi:hypothetical protein
MTKTQERNDDVDHDDYVEDICELEYQSMDFIDHDYCQQNQYNNCDNINVVVSIFVNR